jgi:hypothetical protein
MWGNWFGISPSASPPPPSSPEKNKSEETKEFVYLIEGALRVPLELPLDLKKNFPALSEWIFKNIGSEQCVFKWFPDNYIYWYNANESSSQMGILMKYETQTNSFTGISSDPDEELPQIQVPKKEVIVLPPTVFEDNNTNKAYQKPPTKRNRSRK